MTERPPRKEYSLRSREKQPALSNYVNQVGRNEVGQEQDRHLNMKQTSSISVRQDKENQQLSSHHPKKETRIYYNIMTNVSVISAPVKPDKPATHGRNNNGKASNHEMINDACKTGNWIINDDNQGDLNMQFYETSRYCNQSETNVMPVY